MRCCLWFILHSIPRPDRNYKIMQVLVYPGGIVIKQPGAGEEFFDFATTALVPVDGTDVYYSIDQVSNFDEVFGTNTDYVVDPEECMADNFSFAMVYGMDGPEHKGYHNPEIIEGIIDILCR